MEIQVLREEVKVEQNGVQKIAVTKRFSSLVVLLGGDDCTSVGHSMSKSAAVFVFLQCTGHFIFVLFCLRLGYLIRNWLILII